MLVYSTDQAGPNSQFCDTRYAHRRRKGTIGSMNTPPSRAARCFGRGHRCNPAWPTRYVTATSEILLLLPRTAMLELKHCYNTLSIPLLQPRVRAFCGLAQPDATTYLGSSQNHMPKQSQLQNKLTGGFHLGFFKPAYLNTSAATVTTIDSVTSTTILLDDCMCCVFRCWNLAQGSLMGLCLACLVRSSTSCVLLSQRVAGFATRDKKHARYFPTHRTRN